MKTESNTIDTPAPKAVSTNKTNKNKPIVNIKDLTEKAIIVKFSMGYFTAKKKDKVVSKEVANDKDASISRVALEKKLLQSKELDAVISCGGAIRLWFREKTKPWTREGEGVLSTRKYMEFKTELEEKCREFHRLADAFMNQYDIIRQADALPSAAGGLGELYNDADYPSKESMRARFYTKIIPMPLPKDDFRCNVMSDTEVSEINKQIEEFSMEAYKEGERESLGRVRDKLNNLLLNLAKTEGGRFHKTNFTNLFDTLKNVADLNFTDNPVIDEALTEVAKKLISYDADIIKDNKVKRNEAVEDTKAAIAKIDEAMKSFM